MFTFFILYFPFPVYNLVILATCAAFLALMALKLKNNQICQQRTPNGPVDMKKW